MKLFVYLSVLFGALISRSVVKCTGVYPASYYGIKHNDGSYNHRYGTGGFNARYATNYATGAGGQYTAFNRYQSASSGFQPNSNAAFNGVSPNGPFSYRSPYNFGYGSGSPPYYTNSGYGGDGRGNYWYRNRAGNYDSPYAAGRLGAFASARSNSGLPNGLGAYYPSSSFGSYAGQSGAGFNALGYQPFTGGRYNPAISSSSDGSYNVGYQTPVFLRQGAGNAGKNFQETNRQLSADGVTSRDFVGNRPISGGQQPSPISPALDPPSRSRIGNGPDYDFSNARNSGQAVDSSRNPVGSHQLFGSRLGDSTGIGLGNPRGAGLHGFQSDVNNAGFSQRSSGPVDVVNPYINDARFSGSAAGGPGFSRENAGNANAQNSANRPLQQGLTNTGGVTNPSRLNNGLRYSPFGQSSSGLVGASGVGGFGQGFNAFDGTNRGFKGSPAGAANGAGFSFGNTQDTDRQGFTNAGQAFTSNSAQQSLPYKSRSVSGLQDTIGSLSSVASGAHNAHFEHGIVTGGDSNVTGSSMADSAQSSGAEQLSNGSLNNQSDNFQVSSQIENGKSVNTSTSEQQTSSVKNIDDRVEELE
ncbi:uncharacterized PPE family protein PPE40-like isoform X2 [Wyeomyia smithii]|uniref:uncharacterized PPE family protein PPE40-like isoform X2 n=1 Tax=Wyeomyia smithii TaxID=174621 RepID=UPI0024681E01|nr:uncharacterized PPE family protein PPE40-like isoform X2 [Wyeomyia smithii]